jgi:hypothetical protein
MKRNGLFIVLFFTAVMFLVNSCGREAEDTTIDDEMTYDERDNRMGDRTMTDQNNFWTYDRDYNYEQRSEFREDVNASLDRLNQRIDELETKAENSTGDTKEWYNDRADELKDKRSEIEEDMRDFDDVTQDAWDDFKSGVTTAWNEIEETWNNIATDDRFEEDGQY